MIRLHCRALASWLASAAMAVLPLLTVPAHAQEAAVVKRATQLRDSPAESGASLAPLEANAVVTRTSERLGYPAPDGSALLALTPEQRSRELRQRLGALLGGEHLIGPLLAVLRGELAQVLTLTPELQSLAALGLIETRPLQLYQVTWATRDEEP